VYFHESFEKVQIPGPGVLDGKYKKQNDPWQYDETNEKAEEQI